MKRITYECNGCEKDEYEVDIPEHSDDSTALYIATASFHQAHAERKDHRANADVHYCTACGASIRKGAEMDLPQQASKEQCP